ncbi:MAG: HD domain-containing protein [Patescibacteria group bacterium]
MIPSYDQIQTLWNTHALPQNKQKHCRLVAQTALWFARQLVQKNLTLSIDTRLLEAAALVHDIDKMAQKKSNEHHPDAAVRILRESGYDEVADLVRTHPLHAILDQSITPKTWEQKLLYLSDKMVKYTIITVDARFALWSRENLPEQVLHEMNAAYPKVKALEKEICTAINVLPRDVARLANKEETSTMMLSLKGGTL